MKIYHKEQFHGWSCGAVCYAMLFDVTEGRAIADCKTTKSGTQHIELLRAIKTRENAYLISIEKGYEEYLSHLKDISSHFPVIVSGFYHRQGTRGRCRKDAHAVLVVDGVVFDPAESGPIDLDAYEIVFNRGWTIRSIIVVDREVDGYGMNK